MNNNTLSIDALESDLLAAEKELEKAREERLRVLEIENQWSTEVTSLRNLIEIRRKRLNLPSILTSTEESSATPYEHAPKHPLSSVAWIEHTVRASGNNGKTPSEILRDAEGVGRKMHKNYPYVALAHLVEKGKVSKRDGRYYATV